ncbi:RNA-binding motif protein, X-linked 2 [Pelobates fuscus]|uniref:RNA-binding motif protein, X-linked 2 n=1 Tax=Pelobates fuscus TaxID=191477 RepID=UPI002FE4638F
MNPLTKVKLINELNAREASLGVKESVSWHQDYKDSAWLFIGGLPFQLTEGDVICVFSQYGEIVNLNLIRDKDSGRSRGFCFLCYEDQRSTVLAVDNLNGIKLKGRTIRVDHVANYKPPKDFKDMDEVTKTLREVGCGARTPPPSSSSEEEEEEPRSKRKKKKAVRNESGTDQRAPAIKQERVDPAYDKYNPAQTVRRDPEEGRASHGRSHGKHPPPERPRDPQQEDTHRGKERREERPTQREWKSKKREPYI